MVTLEEMNQIAQLAKLCLSPQALPSLTQEIERMVAFADQISSATPDAPLPVIHAGMTLAKLRADDILPSLPREGLLEAAGGGCNGYFVAGEEDISR